MVATDTLKLIPKAVRGMVTQAINELDLDPVRAVRLRDAMYKIIVEDKSIPLNRPGDVHKRALSIGAQLKEGALRLGDLRPFLQRVIEKHNLTDLHALHLCEEAYAQTRGRKSDASRSWFTTLRDIVESVLPLKTVNGKKRHLLANAESHYRSMVVADQPWGSWRDPQTMMEIVLGSETAQAAGSGGIIERIKKLTGLDFPKEQLLLPPLIEESANHGSFRRPSYGYDPAFNDPTVQMGSVGVLNELGCVMGTVGGSYLAMYGLHKAFTGRKQDPVTGEMRHSWVEKAKGVGYAVAGAGITVYSIGLGQPKVPSGKGPRM